MEAVDVNGGNAEVARDEPNLENPLDEMPESQQEVVADNTTINVKMEETSEVNGDVKSPKKKATPVFRRKLRILKANSTSNAETDVKPNTKGQKRKLSEPDDVSSEDSTEFNGFDTNVLEASEPGTQVLQKLIAEAESAESPPSGKRRRRSTSKIFTTLRNLDDNEDDTEMDDAAESTATIKTRRDKGSDTDSIGVPNSFEAELDPLKTDESSAKSANSSANSSPSGVTPRFNKVMRTARGISPGGALKQKISIDMSNPLFREPFKYGWKRELVFRAGSEHAVRRMADIYYYTPKGKKVRSFREVAEFLNTKELTIDNFTFFKEPLGVNNPDFEIIRDARVRDSTGPAPTPPKKYVTPKKTPAKKSVEKPLTPPLPPAKVAAKSPKVTPAGFKIKLPAKRGQQKKEVTKSPPKEPEMLPPQWNSLPSTRRSQAAVEKTPPAKTKRVLKAKLQEPCSIRCSTSMGLIPSLQCSVCLCLYHPECVGDVDRASSVEYVCKNCREDSSSKSQQHQQVATTVPPPPPLIPISMISSQTPKTSTSQPAGASLPKLQRISKADGTTETKKSTKSSNIPHSSASPSPDRTDGSWLQAGNEFLHSHDGTVPKPAQNIALMAGKRYIVVPKNNAMAVQPAVTVRPEKIGDKAPALPEASHSDMQLEDSTGSRLSPKPTSDIAIKATESDNESSKEKTEVMINPSESSVSEFDETMDEKPAGVDSSETKESTENISTATDATEIITSKIETEARIEESGLIVSSEVNAEATIKETTAISEEMEAKIKLEIPEATSSGNLPQEKNVETATENLQSAAVATNSVCAQPEIKKKIIPTETDQRHFMVSVCAGYHALSRIFQYLKVQELLRAARVCKMWRDLAAHPNLWKTVRMKNSQVTDWDGLADSLKRHGTQHLDLRKMLVAGESDGIWKKFVTVIPRVTSLVKLELCRCPVMVVEEVIKSCPQLEILSAMSIKCDSLNLESVGNLKSCQELRLKAISGMSLQGDLSPLQELTQLTHLSLTSVKELGKKKVDILASLINLETLELGECSDFPDKFGTAVLLKLEKLERLRLEKGQGTCCTFDILEGVSKLPSLNQLELVNFDVKNGFDKCLSNCKNIKRLLIIPTYISQSATSNNMVLGGVTELSNNLTHFVWGVTLELLRVTELFVDQCNQMNKQVTGDSIPVLKPVPCLKLIEDVEDDSDPNKDEKPQPNLTNPQVDILPLPQLQKLLLTALPKTRVKILKIPFHATWRQSISDTTTQ